MPPFGRQVRLLGAEERDMLEVLRPGLKSRADAAAVGVAGYRCRGGPLPAERAQPAAVKL